MNDFARVNEVYGEFFEGAIRRRAWPSRRAGLPKGADVEIDAIVAL